MNSSEIYNVIKDLDFNNLKDTSLVLEPLIEGIEIEEVLEEFIINESCEYGNYFTFSMIDSDKFKTKEKYDLLMERIVDRIESLRNVKLDVFQKTMYSGIEDQIKLNIHNKEIMFDLFTPIAMLEYLHTELSN